MFKYNLEELLKSKTVTRDSCRTIYSSLCFWCKNPFWLLRPFKKNRINKFCSQQCKAYFDWKNKLNNGYVGCLDNKGYIRWKIGKKQKRAHRWLVEQKLGRELSKNEWVHHKNGDKSDNKLENLMVVTHTNPHHEVKCPKCQYEFRIH